MSEATKTTVRYQIYEYSQIIKRWMYVTTPTENEEEARRDLDDLRRIYVDARFKLVKIESTVTVLEEPAS
jgi:hypothetical protein